MKIVMITVMTPAAENVRGTSALPYHLLVHRDKGIRVELYSFNLNQLDEEQVRQTARRLDVTIHILPIPKWYTWFFRLHLLVFRLLLSYPIGNYIKLKKADVRRIRALEPDGIWIYGEELSRVSRQFSEYRRVHTLPDCESLYYYRMMGNRFSLSSARMYWRYALMYPKYVNMERRFDRGGNVSYHLVGKADAEQLRTVSPGIRARFIRHPHYEIRHDDERGDGGFHAPVRILVAGQNNVYMSQGARELVEVLCNKYKVEDTDLRKHYELTFLGKGWETYAEHLRLVGWNVNVTRFAPDYIEEIRKYDIQITPISIGTGTKGKVLDALANGLLVMGTEYAMENIAVEHQESCIVYQDAAEVVSYLEDMVGNAERYERMALNGKRRVQELHGRELLSAEMFALFDE